MSNLNTIVQALLKCGYLDVEFIEKELDNFNVDADDVIDYHKDHFGEGVSDVNAFIHCLYEVAFNNAIDELDLGGVIDFDKHESFCNCLDSHFYLKDNNGDWHGVHSYDEIIDFLSVNHNPQDDVHRS